MTSYLADAANWLRMSLLLAVAACCGNTSADADTVTLSTLGSVPNKEHGQSWLNITPGHPPRSVDGNVLVGLVPSSEFIEFRNFFTFVIPASAQPFKSATLMLGRGRGDTDAPDGFETWGVFDVDASLSTLYQTSDPGAIATAFEDLGTGVSYGEFQVDPEPNDIPDRRKEILSFELNSAAISDLNQARGSRMTLGGRLLTITSQIDAAFGGPISEVGNAKLVLVTVPEPATCGMLALGFVGLTAIRRRAQ
jgi:hypothetical protein